MKGSNGGIVLADFLSFRMFWGGESFADSEVLAHFHRELFACELELENVAVVIDLILADDLELCFDGFGVLARDLLDLS